VPLQPSPGPPARSTVPSCTTPPVYPWRGLAAFVASVPRPVWGDPGLASELLALGITVTLGMFVWTLPTPCLNLAYGPYLGLA
jgi:hypothetical protein